MKFEIEAIGYIETPHEDPVTAPIQPSFTDSFGTVVVYENFKDGLKDLEGFSHLILLYRFHKAQTFNLLVGPYLAPKKRGVFATRHQNRPNFIGLSIVQLVKVEGNKLLVKGIDVLNNTPLIDIKPLVPKFDLKNINQCKVGWLKGPLSERDD
ncbi:MAG: tRNA (N6-threonylcarbamoyladenosine(37)-N6)-methyltransferase TrmO [Candidatus Heimdallarchaeaceae archaeon]